MNIERPKSKQPIPEHATRVFEGVIFDVYQWQQDMYDGSKKMFEKIKRLDTVIVFPVLDDGRILLTEQEQPGMEPFCGATGGRVERGEDVLAAAARELREESGYEASEFILWDARQPATKIDWAVYTFIAKGLMKVGEPAPDAGEKIREKIVTLDELIELSRQERFAEKEIVMRLMEAKIDPEKRKELEELFALRK